MRKGTSHLIRKRTKILSDLANFELGRQIDTQEIYKSVISIGLGLSDVRIKWEVPVNVRVPPQPPPK